MAEFSNITLFSGATLEDTAEFSNIETFSGATLAALEFSNIERFQGATLASAVELSPDSLAVGQPVLGEPVVTQLHEIGGGSLAAGSPVMGEPEVMQTHYLASGDLAVSSVELGAPGITQPSYADSCYWESGYAEDDAPCGELLPNNLAAGQPVLGTPSVTTAEPEFSNVERFSGSTRIEFMSVFGGFDRSPAREEEEKRKRTLWALFLGV